MRSRYQPDGSVDPEADRMLEILRQADDELARQQREAAQRSTGFEPHHATSKASAGSFGDDDPMAPPKIMAFMKDPFADLLANFNPPNPNDLLIHPNDKPSTP